MSDYYILSPLFSKLPKLNKSSWRVSESFSCFLPARLNRIKAGLWLSHSSTSICLDLHLSFVALASQSQFLFQPLSTFLPGLFSSIHLTKEQPPIPAQKVQFLSHFTRASSFAFLLFSLHGLWLIASDSLLTIGISLSLFQLRPDRFPVLNCRSLQSHNWPHWCFSD